MILLPPAPNPSTTTQLFSMLFTALGLHRQRMYLHGLCLSVLGLMTQPPRTEIQNKSSIKCYHAHTFPVQRKQPSRTRIGGGSVSHTPQSPPPYGAERSCPFLPQGQGGRGRDPAVLSGCS